MTKKQAQRYYHLMTVLRLNGIAANDAESLLKIERALHRWAERVCDGDIVRDEKTGKAYAVYGHNGPGEISRFPTADKEAGALKRLRTIMDKYPTMTWYNQTDPRGCALYVMTKESLKGLDISSHYSKGMAVCY